MKKIVLSGPSRSGKSCLREGLKQVLMGFEDAPYPYVITACPDGEGAWFQEAVRNDPGVADLCKTAYKGKFTDEFANLAASWVTNCKLPLTLVDIGGRIDDKNYRICRSATHIVILAGDDPKTGKEWGIRMDPWREFANQLDLTIVAEVVSDYSGTADVVGDVDSDNILRGTIHRLERGEDASKRPMIRRLAQHLLDL